MNEEWVHEQSLRDQDALFRNKEHQRALLDVQAELKEKRNQVENAEERLKEIRLPTVPPKGVRRILILSFLCVRKGEVSKRKEEARKLKLLISGNKISLSELEVEERYLKIKIWSYKSRRGTARG